MGEHWTDEQLLCHWSHCHFISWIWSVKQHCLQDGHRGLCHSWRHIYRLAHALISRKCHVILWKKKVKKKEMGIIQTSLLRVLIYGQCGLQDWQVHSGSSLHVQRGHVATWTCWFCRVRVMFEVLCSTTCSRMIFFDMS